METLELDDNNLYTVDPNQSFPNLKTLTIDLIGELDTEHLNRLLENCPSLEKLSVEVFNIDYDTESVWTISIPTLRELSFAVTGDNFGTPMPNQFVINTPNLKSLTIEDSFVCCFDIKEIPYTLETVWLDIGKTNYVVDFELEDDEVGSRVQDELEGVKNTTNLTLGWGTNHLLKFNFEEHDCLPTFQYLKKLVLYVDYYFGFFLLSEFLANSPLLESLELIRECVFDKCKDDDFGWDPPAYPPRCLAYTLRDIRVLRFGGREEWPAIKYLLENGRVLETMSIGLRHSSVQDEAAIRNFPKGREECRVHVYVEN